MKNIEKQTNQLETILTKYSSAPESLSDELSIVLAAGHGKRIKSSTSKMLHEIWGLPTVIRVANAAGDGLDSSNQIIVVGIKAAEVTAAVGKSPNRMFTHQETQNGTGHAVAIALEQISNHYEGDIYIFPGDMGLLDAGAIRDFKGAFNQGHCDMMVLTGLFDGDVNDNYYGRIVRVPDKDVNGQPAGDDVGKVVEIKEHKDILALANDEFYNIKYKDRDYRFSKNELIKNREFNSGVFAFKAAKLCAFINKINTDNVQGELYLTDLISIFNENNLTVGAEPAADNRSVLGFNTKSVLREMNEIAREIVYESLKSIVAIDDPHDFFVADDVVQQIIQLDVDRAPIDIHLGKGAFIGRGVKVNRGLFVDRSATVTGNVTIGEDCFFGHGVTVSGDEDQPTVLGDGVCITGNSFISGCRAEDGVLIEHSIIKNKLVRRRLAEDGSVLPVRFVRPEAEGLDSIETL